MELENKILIVDDLEANLFALEKVLEGESYAVLKALSGEEALKIAIRENISLILLDVQMPEMDGFEVATLLKGSKRTNHIPIIFVTALSQEKSNIEKGLITGAVDYISKPYDPDILKIKINNFLKIVNQEKIIKKNFEDLNHYNEKINSSIRYAKSLQERVFSSFTDLNKVFSDSFLIDLPKETVGGDFFFMHQHENKVILSVADCTGHGVTGALLAVIGNNFLNIIMKEKKYNPSAVIEDLFNQWIVLFKKDKSHYDSMDLAVCTIHLDEKYVEFASLLRPLLMINSGNLHEYKGDQFSFANSYLESSSSFSKNEITTHRIDYKSGDMLYMSTDGICDQFGGPDEKKFSNKRLRNLLLRIHKLAAKSQGIIIKEEFDKWKKDNVQIDDVMLLGIKIT